MKKRLIRFEIVFIKLKFLLKLKINFILVYEFLIKIGKLVMCKKIEK